MGKAEKSWTKVGRASQPWAKLGKAKLRKEFGKARRKQGKAADKVEESWGMGKAEESRAKLGKAGQSWVELGKAGDRCMVLELEIL